MMCGYLMGMAVFGAAIRDYMPKGKSGMFQGLRIVGQVLIPGVIGPEIGSAILKNAATILNDDGRESFIPDARIFLASLVVLIVLIPVLIPSNSVSLIQELSDLGQKATDNFNSGASVVINV